MSLDLDARLKAFLATAPQTVHQIQTLEFGHSAFGVRVLWREPYAGSITTEEGIYTASPVNFSIKLAGTEANLDQNYEIRLDLTNIDDSLREVLDAVPLTAVERIKCIYREYLSDDLTAYLARAVLQVDSISYQVGAATLAAVSPRLNMTSTGERYVIRDIPMLRGFL